MVFSDQLVFNEEIGTYEQRVPGKSRIAGIGRIAITCRPERQHLPQRLTRGLKEIGEGVGLRPEIADTERSRQRRRMKQHTTRSGKIHDGSLDDSSNCLPAT